MEGSAGFAGFCEAMGSFERLGEALGGFGILCEVLEILDGLLWEALGLEGFGKVLKSLGGALGGCGFSIVCLSPRLWEALGSFGSLWEALGSFGRLWEALGSSGKLWYAS